MGAVGKTLASRVAPQPRRRALCQSRSSLDRCPPDRMRCLQDKARMYQKSLSAAFPRRTACTQHSRRAGLADVDAQSVLCSSCQQELAVITTQLAALSPAFPFRRVLMVAVELRARRLVQHGTIVTKIVEYEPDGMPDHSLVELIVLDPESRAVRLTPQAVPRGLSAVDAGPVRRPQALLNARSL